MGSEKTDHLYPQMGYANNIQQLTEDFLSRQRINKSELQMTEAFFCPRKKNESNFCPTYQHVISRNDESEKFCIIYTRR